MTVKKRLRLQGLPMRGAPTRRGLLRVAASGCFKAGEGADAAPDARLHQNNTSVSPKRITVKIPRICRQSLLPRKEVTKII